MSFLLLSSLALAAPQLKVRAALVVVSEDHVPASVRANSEQDFVGLLQGSGRYLLLDPMVIQARTGGDADALVARCGGVSTQGWSGAQSSEESACWAQVTADLAADQLLLLRVSGTTDEPIATLEVRDAAWPDSPRRYQSALPRGGGAPIDILEDAFFAQGSLRVRAPAGVRMSLDGESLGEVGGLLELPLVEGGKHTLGMVDAQGGQHLLVVQVVPGRETQVDFVPPPPVLVRRRWGPWASAAIIGGSVAWFVVARDAPGRAWETDPAE